MDGIFKRLQAFVKDLQARFSSLSMPSKIFAGLAILALAPFVAVGGTKWKGWVKALVCFFLLCLMLFLVLGLLMVALVFCLIWFIWKKTGWKTYLKVAVTVGVLAVPVALALAFVGMSASSDAPAPSIPPVIQAAPDTTPVPSNVPALPSPSEIQATPDAAPSANETVPPATQPPVEETPPVDVAAEPVVYTVGGIDYCDFEGLIEVGSIIYIKDEGNMIPYLEVLEFGENQQNPGGTPISNAVYVKELPFLFGDTSSRWRDLDEMLRHNKETREAEGSPVYYVEAAR